MRRLILCGFLFTTACHKDRPPAPTAEQSAQLNDADDMLDKLANEEGPADRGPHQSSTLMGPSSASPSNKSD